MEAPKKPSMVGATRTVPATATTAGPASTTYATIVSTGSAGTARASPLGDAPPPGVGGKEKLSDAQRNIQRFWPAVMRDVQQVDSVEPGNQLLPLARIKKIMKLDEDVKMISSDAPLLFAKAIEIFIQELTLRAWQHTEHNKRRTLQRSDIAMAITKYDQFDFLIDIVPRDEIKKEFDGPKPDAEGTAEPDGAAATEDLQYILQLAQQQLAQQTGKVLDLTAVRTVPISHQEQAVMQAVADALAAKKTHPPMATAATAAAAPSGVAMASRTGTLTAMKLGKVVPAGVDQQTAAIAIAPTTLQQQVKRNTNGNRSEYHTSERQRHGHDDDDDDGDGGGSGEWWRHRLLHHRPDPRRQSNGAAAPARNITERRNHANTDLDTPEPAELHPRDRIGDRPERGAVDLHTGGPTADHPTGTDDREHRHDRCLPQRQSTATAPTAPAAAAAAAAQSITAATPTSTQPSTAARVRAPGTCPATRTFRRGFAEQPVHSILPPTPREKLLTCCVVVRFLLFKRPRLDGGTLTGCKKIN